MMKGLGIFLLFVSLCHGTIAHVVSTCAGGAGASTDIDTSAVDTTGATLLTVTVGGVGTAVVSDSKGNTWHYGTPKTNSTVTIVIAYAWDHGGSPLSVGSGHTVNVTGLSYPGGCFSSWSGTKTSATPLDQESSADCNNCTSQLIPSVTPGFDNELIITGITQNNSGTPTIDSGYGTLTHFELVASNAVDMTIGDLVQTSAAATAPTWSFSTSPILITVLATFQAADATGVRRRFIGQ